MANDRAITAVGAIVKGNTALSEALNGIDIESPTEATCRNIGAVIFSSPVLENKFFYGLINKVGKQVINEKTYRNPLEVLEAGTLEFGEIVEEIFINLAKPFQYDPDVSQYTFHLINRPDVVVAYHVVNAQIYYKDSISRKEAKRAFYSWEGVDKFISGVITSMYNGLNQDKFLMTKYMIAYRLVNGQMAVKNIPAISAANMQTIGVTIKETIGDMEYYRNDLNYANVDNFVPAEDQILIVTNKFKAYFDFVELASAYNLEYKDLMARIITIDSFGTGLDNPRYDELLKDDKLRHTFTSDEITALNGVAAVLADREFFRIYRQDNEVTDTLYIPEARMVNYWLYYDGIFSTSPFANAVAFSGGTPAISAITATPSSFTAPQDYSEYIVTTAVTASDFADTNLIVSVSGDAPVEVSQIDANHWKIQIADTIEFGESATITWTSRANSSVTATHTITTAGISLDKSAVTVTAAAGGSHTASLTATKVPSNASVTWASSDTSKATVSNGTVTGVAAGTCKVTASITTGGKTYTAECDVTVS